MAVGKLPNENTSHKDRHNTDSNTQSNRSSNISNQNSPCRICSKRIFRWFRLLLLGCWFSLFWFGFFFWSLLLSLKMAQKWKPVMQRPVSWKTSATSLFGYQSKIKSLHIINLVHFSDNASKEEVNPQWN